MPPTPHPEAPPLCGLTARDQVALLLLLAGYWLVLAARWLPAWTGAGVVDLDETPPRAPRLLVELNTAEPAELELLPGVGPKLAARIVERRERTPFRSAAELCEVRGIGPRTWERLRSQVVVLPDDR